MIYVEVSTKKPETDHAVGGDKGPDAQEEDEEVTYWHRHEPFREQFERRQSQSEEGLVCLMITSCDPTLLHGSTSIWSFRRIGLNEAGALPPTSIPFPTFSPGFFSSLSRTIFSTNLMRNWLAWHRSQRHHPSRQRSQLTGLANHLPPPLSNQLRCPPSEVVHNTPKALCWNSRNGIASFTAICGLLACCLWEHLF